MKNRHPKNSIQYITPLFLLSLIFNLAFTSLPAGRFKTQWSKIVSDRISPGCKFNPRNPTNTNLFTLHCLYPNDPKTIFYIDTHVMDKSTGVVHSHTHTYPAMDMRKLVSYYNHPKIDFMVGAEQGKVYLHRILAEGVFTPGDLNYLKYVGVYKLSGHPNTLSYQGQIGNDHFMTIGDQDITNNLYFWELDHVNLEDGTSHILPADITITPVKIYTFSTLPVGTFISYFIMGDSSSFYFKGRLTSAKPIICKYDHDFNSVSDKSTAQFLEVNCIPQLPNNLPKYDLIVNPENLTVLYIFAKIEQEVITWNPSDNSVSSLSLATPNYNSIPLEYKSLFPVKNQDLYVGTSQDHEGIYLADRTTGASLGKVEESSTLYHFASIIYDDPKSNHLVVFSRTKSPDPPGVLYKLYEFVTTGCDPDCSYCGNDASPSDRSKCLTCVDPILTFYPNSTEDGGYCGCDSSCDTCNGPLSTNCLSCSTTFLSASNTCISDCGTGKTSAPTNNICQDCISPCDECSTEAINCLSCDILTLDLLFLPPTNRCVADCPIGTFNQAGTCQSCDPTCLECDDLGATICTSCRPGDDLINSTCLPPIFLLYNLAQINEFSPEGKITLELALIYKETKSPVELIPLKNYLLDQLTFQFQISGETQTAEIKWKEYQIMIELSISDHLRIGDSQEVMSTINEPRLFSDAPANMLVEANSQIIGINFPEKIDLEMLKHYTTTAKSVGAVSEYSSQTVVYFTSVTSVISADSTFSLFCVAQIFQLISNFKQINLNYGPLLTKFLDQIGILSIKTEDNPDNLILHQRGQKAKFSKHNILLSYIDFSKESFTKNLRFYFYALSWILKMFLLTWLRHKQRSKKITVIWSYFFIIHQRLHHFLYNMNILDLVFYGLRAAFHSKLHKFSEQQSLFLVCFVVSLAFLDSLEIVRASLNAFTSISINMKEVKKLKIKNSIASSKNSQLFNNLRRQSLRASIRNTPSSPNHHLIQKKIEKIPWTSKMEISRTEKIREKISLEELKIHGFKRTFDGPKTLQLFKRNRTIEKFSTENMKLNRIKNRFLLLFRFCFLLRIIFYQVIIVSLPLFPMVQILSLLTFEICYNIFICYGYFKYKHLKHLHHFLNLTGESFFLLLLHIIFLIIKLQTQNINQDPPLSLQRAGAIILLLLLCFENIFLLIRFWFILKSLYKSLVKSKHLSEKALKRKASLQFELVYKWTKLCRTKDLLSGQKMGLHSQAQGQLQKVNNIFNQTKNTSQLLLGSQNKIKNNVSIPLKPNKSQFLKKTAMRKKAAPLLTRNLQVIKKYEMKKRIKEARSNL